MVTQIYLLICFKKMLIHLVAIIYKVDHMAFIQYSIIANSASKNLLQRHAANDPCDWKPLLSCRSEGIKLDVPEYHWHCQMDASSKWNVMSKVTGIET
jgi:hypothetical protein